MAASRLNEDFYRTTSKFGRMEVGFLVDSLSTGGAETMLLRQVQHSNRRPIVFHLGGSTDLEADFEDGGARVVDLGIRSILNPGEMNRARATLAQYDLDVLHAHLPYSMIVARLVGRAAGIGTTVSTHHDPTNYSPAIRTLELATRPLDRVQIAVSNAVKRGHETSFDFDEWVVVYNGIDVPAFNDRVTGASRLDYINAQGPVFLNVGRYVWEKGQRDLITAMRYVVDERPDVQAVLVGYGPLHSELEAAVERMDLTDSVHITGKVPNRHIHRYYAMADAFVLPSVSEGFPITALEAMAAELPTVGTRIPGIEEAITNDVGVLVPPRSPRRLAEAMITTLADEPQSVGERAYCRVHTQFDISRLIDAHERLYDQLTTR